jgi:hypothetical protein
LCLSRLRDVTRGEAVRNSDDTIASCGFILANIIGTDRSCHRSDLSCSWYVGAASSVAGESCVPLEAVVFVLEGVVGAMLVVKMEVWDFDFI